MNPRFRSGWWRSVEIVAVALLVAAAPAPACGPDFPNQYIHATETELLAAPEGFFGDEVARIAAEIKSVHRAVVPEKDSDQHCREIERDQLRRALLEAGRSPNEARALADAWKAFRERPTEAQSDSPPPEPPAGLPREFALYGKGALAWHRRDFAGARSSWEALLALPEAERRNRSVWAAYMLGRTWGREAFRWNEEGRAAWEETQRAFRQARELAAAGFPDPLGLAAESYGWEAKAAVGREKFAQAVNLYLTQHAAGDPTAVASLRFTCAKLVQLEDLSNVAEDANSRRILTAYIVARGGSYEVDFERPPPFADWARHWALALEQARISFVPEADRLAWLAYEGGLFVLAEQWVKLAPEEAPVARWIRAKLALRAGNLREGARLLGTIGESGQLAVPQRRIVYAELGRARLALGDFGGALEAWLRGGHWPDAAYLAERVMTTGELGDFLGRNPVTVVVSTAPLRGDWWLPRDQQAGLRHLLGRRLARAAQLDLAEPYFPEALRPVLHGYAADVKVGFDLTRPALERAEAFWRAARAVREQGMELLGTEFDPDWRIWGGSFTEQSMAEERKRAALLAGGVFTPVPEELQRLEQHRVPERRFHYRYRAAELAWWAASLLPNESDATAQILDTAGRWLAARDPQAARPFFQALVIRCGTTALGRGAAAKRWFSTGAAAKSGPDGPTTGGETVGPPVAIERPQSSNP